jgi:predicted GNAT family acetyltransferase
MATLFIGLDAAGARIAMVEEVATVRAFRERGLAQAVICAAVGAALAEGARLIVIPADAEDWPQLLYAKLGFEPLGIQVALTLRTS